MQVIQAVIIEGRRELSTHLTRNLRTLIQANIATIWAQAEAVQAVLGS